MNGEYYWITVVLMINTMKSLHITGEGTNNMPTERKASVGASISLGSAYHYHTERAKS